MKKFNGILLYIVLLLLLTGGSCIRPEQELPSGDHSFYCYIDGELFVPKGFHDVFSESPPNDGLFFVIYEDYFHVHASDNKKYFVMFNIVDWHTGTFQLNNSSGITTDRSINHAIVKINGVWYLSKENSGTVTFTEAGMDENTEGTFEFTLYNENDDSDIIHVTGGHFND